MGESKAVSPRNRNKAALEGIDELFSRHDGQRSSRKVSEEIA